MAYLDGNGLLYFWQKIKNTFTLKADAIKNITRSGTTFTATRADGTTFTFTQQDNNTTYTAASATPLMDGTGAVGTSAKYAREDHVHPSDTTKVDKVSGKGLSTNDFTDSDKTKLTGIAAGAEVNQNAFSNVKVGSTTVTADGKTDTLELAAGSNVTLTPDATNDKVTIAAKDTTYSDATTSIHGLMSTADKTKLDGIEAGATKVWYGLSATMGDEVEKVVRCEGFTLTAGALVLVDFSQKNSASSITMNVNGTGALPVQVHGSRTNAPKLDTYNPYLFRYFESSTGQSYWSLIEGAAALKTGANATNSSATPTNTSSRQYAVVLDNDGYLSVNVPWENTQRTYSSYTGVPTENLTPNFGDTFTIHQIKQSTTGQVSGTARTVKIPNTEATGSAAGLMSAADKNKLAGIDSGAKANVYPYGECSTSATSSAKTVTVDSKFTLVAGAVVYVRFTVSNSASVTTLSLNVNGTGAKPMHWYGGQLPNKDVIWQNRLYCFIYDGENWNIVGDIEYRENMTLAMANAGSSYTGLYISPSVLKQYVTGEIAAAQVGAATFKGTVTSGTDISGLTAYKKGWYWVVATAGTYAGQSCEAGDMIFCISDYSSAYKAADFSIIQNNIVTITNAEIDTIVAS